MPSLHPPTCRSDDFKQLHFNVALVVFLICWTITAILIYQRVLRRSERHFFQNPLGKEMSFPNLLLHQSREIHPQQKRVIFLGDSTVYGTSSSSPTATIPGRLSHYLKDPQTLVFSLSTQNLGLDNFVKMIPDLHCQNDFLILEFIPTPRHMTTSRPMTCEDWVAPTGWHALFTMIRGEVASTLERRPPLLLFDGMSWMKRCLVQRTIKPKPHQDDLCSFSMTKEAHDPTFVQHWKPILNEPLTDGAIRALDSVLSLTMLRPHNTLFYLAPVNPYMLDATQSGEGSVFEANCRQIEKKLRSAGFRVLNYAHPKDLLNTDDFHDIYHLTDQGCDQLAKQLALDLKK